MDDSYARPTVLLSAQCNVPTEFAGTSQRTGNSNLCEQAAHEARDCHRRLTSEVIASTALQSTLAPMLGAISQIDARFDTDRRSILMLQDSCVVEPEIFMRHPAYGQFPQDRARGFVVYDRYFAVVRPTTLSGRVLLAQVASTSRRVLADLPSAMVNRDEIVALIGAMSQMYVWLSREGGDMRLSSPSLLSASEWIPDSQQLVGASLASYRWRIGHHFFNLCCNFCRSSLDLAAAYVKSGQAEGGAEALQLAEVFLRATTAAMWYAGDFPKAFYRDSVRPSMQSTDSPDGFSGTQNLDYYCLKEAKKEFKVISQKSYGTLARWPAALVAAFEEFHETDIEDSEHHTLIAASKVGSAESLAQEVFQKEMPQSLRRRNAVQSLRRSAQEKHREYSALVGGS